MGLPESRQGKALAGIPSPEVQEAVRERVKKTITTLLKNGGAITNSGKIVTFDYSQVNAGRLTISDIKNLALTSILTVPAGQADLLFTQGAIKGESVHIVVPNTLGKLGYKTGERESTFIWVQGSDSNGKTTYHYQGRGVQTALTRYVDRILTEEGLHGFFPLTRQYAGKILRGIADEHGIGDITRKK